MKKERPILMCGEMVRATLDGRKTQTRRVVKPQPKVVHAIHSDASLTTNCIFRSGDQRIHCPYGQPSDRLYVKEASWIWCEKRKDGLTKTGRQKYRYIPVGQHVVYCADQPKPVKPLDDDPNHCWRWKSGRFMPKWASRITLEIVSVRVERLQEISEDDAKAEGIEGRWHPKDANCWTWKDYAVSSWAPEPRFHYGSMVTPVSTFEGLWDSINAKAHPWASNPWVWVLEFNKLNRI